MKKLCALLIVGLMALTVAFAGGKAEVETKAAPVKSIVVAVGDLGNEEWWPQNSTYSSFVGQSVGDGLVRVMSPLVVKPAIAKEWTVNPEGTRWEFTLRDDAYFSDGTKVTPEDVIFTLEGRQQFQGYSGLKQKITTMEAQGDKVIINCSSPIPQILDHYLSWCPIRPKAYTEKVGVAGFNKKPIGCGPFIFVEGAKGQYYRLARNPNYYGKKPEVDEVIFKIVPEPATRIAMLKTKEADISWNELGPNTAELVRNGLRAQQWSYPAQVPFFFNKLVYNDPEVQKSSIFKDKRIREALTYAIDRNAIANAFYHGMGIPAGEVICVGKSLGRAYNETLKPYNYDVNKAKELLAQAGYPNGFETELRTYEYFKDIAVSVASYWDAVGVKAKVRIYEQSQLFDIWYKRLEPQSDYINLFVTVAFGPAAFAYLDRSAQACTYASPVTDLRKEGDAVVGKANQEKWMREVLCPALYAEMGTIPIVEMPNGVLGLGPRIKEWPETDDHSLGLEFVTLH
jgi:peptide/nickel transport system substrate-binding protein